MIARHGSIKSSVTRGVGAFLCAEVLRDFGLALVCCPPFGRTLKPGVPHIQSRATFYKQANDLVVASYRGLMQGGISSEREPIEIARCGRDV